MCYNVLPHYFIKNKLKPFKYNKDCKQNQYACKGYNMSKVIHLYNLF